MDTHIEQRAIAIAQRCHDVSSRTGKPHLTLAFGQWYGGTAQPIDVVDAVMTNNWIHHMNGTLRPADEYDTIH